MAAKDIKFFKEMLLELRRRMHGDVSTIQKSATKKNRADDSDNRTSMPTHPADIGSDNFDQEFALSLAEVGSGRIREVEEALEKIENGTYGVCEECGSRITKKRLEAIPYAALCIDCANKKSQKR